MVIDEDGWPEIQEETEMDAPRFNIGNMVQCKTPTGWRNAIVLSTNCLTKQGRVAPYRVKSDEGATAILWRDTDDVVRWPMSNKRLQQAFVQQADEFQRDNEGLSVPAGCIPIEYLEDMLSQLGLEIGEEKIDIMMNQFLEIDDDGCITEDVFAMFLG